MTDALSSSPSLKSKKEQRKKILGDALRANLLKRKEQQRGRQKPHPQPLENPEASDNLNLNS
jgi:hypothetical protein